MNNYLDYFQTIKDDLEKNEIIAWMIAAMYIELGKKYVTCKKYSVSPEKLKKSILFRYAYKLTNEFLDTKKLARKDLKQFLIAQFHICGTRSQPSMIVGEKAWMRWIVWKRKFEEVPMIETSEITQENLQRILFSMKASKKFLEGKNLMEACEKGWVRKWVYMGVLDKYYLASKEEVRKFSEEKLGFDVNLYQNQQILSEFNKQEL